MQGIEMFKPERLKLARKMYDGLTKAALAEMLNVTPSTVTKWEDGTHYPQSEALQALAEALQIPAHWFLRDVPKFGEPLFLNRAKKRPIKAPSERSNAMLLNLAEVCMIADEWIELPKINLPEALPRSEALKLNKAKIQDLAEQLRVLWGLGKSPISNLLKRIECAGVVVARFEIGYEEMDGSSAWINNRPYIFIAADKNNYFRGRFDEAHELGHLIMHRYLTHEDKKTMFDELEQQAHYFASCLLFPVDAFIAETSKISLESLMLLKRRWGMSIAALMYKAHSLKLITSEHYERLNRSYRYRNFHKGEPLDAETPPEQPVLLKNMINLMLDEGGFAKSNIIDKLGLKKHLEMLSGLPKGFLNDDFGQMVSMKPSIQSPSPSVPTLSTPQGKIIKFTKPA